MPAAAEASALSSQLTNCPDCQADLAVLRIIPGRAGAEYWTMRCTRCGGIYLDIVGTRSETKSGAESPN